MNQEAKDLLLRLYIRNYRAASQRMYERHFMERNWIAMMMADADCLVDELEKRMPTQSGTRDS